MASNFSDIHFSFGYMATQLPTAAPTSFSCHMDVSRATQVANKQDLVLFHVVIQKQLVTSNCNCCCTTIWKMHCCGLRKTGSGSEEQKLVMKSS